MNWNNEKISLKDNFSSVTNTVTLDKYCNLLSTEKGWFIWGMLLVRIEPFNFFIAAEELKEKQFY